MNGGRVMKQYFLFAEGMHQLFKQFQDANDYPGYALCETCRTIAHTHGDKTTMHALFQNRVPVIAAEKEFGIPISNKQYRELLKTYHREIPEEIYLEAKTKHEKTLTKKK